MKPPGVVRLWRAIASTARAPEYGEHFDREVAPRLGSVPGFIGARVVQREVPEGTEVLVATFWESMTALGAFTGPDLETAVIHPEARALLLRADDRAANYTVVRTFVPEPGPP